MRDPREGKVEPINTWSTEVVKVEILGAEKGTGQICEWLNPTHLLNLTCLSFHKLGKLSSLDQEE